MIDVRDRWIFRMIEEIPELGATVGGQAGFDRIRAKARDEVVRWRGLAVHLEILESDHRRPTAIFHHGYGAYSRLYLPFFGMLAERGFNVVGVDRPGHGLSEGLRGDCTLEALADLTVTVLERTARASFGAPAILMGSSSGGILASCLLPALNGAFAAAVCHGLYDLAWARTGPAGRLLGRIANAMPQARLPYRWLPAAMRRGISSHAVLREWSVSGADPLAALDQTARSVLSMTLGYRPPKPFPEVRTPLLVLTGGDDRMVPAERTIAAFRRARFPNAILEIIPGAGHMLFHERITSLLGRLVPWLEQVLTPSLAER